MTLTTTTKTHAFYAVNKIKELITKNMLFIGVESKKNGATNTLCWCCSGWRHCLSNGIFSPTPIHSTKKNARGYNLQDSQKL